MTKEQILERLEKTQIKLTKLDIKFNKISMSNELTVEFKEFINKCIKNNDYQSIKNYALSKYNKLYMDGIEYDYYHALLDLNDCKQLVIKYTTKLREIEQFESEEKIEVIWNFLTEWEAKAYDWYIQNANLYMELHDKYDEVWEGSKEQYKYESTFKSWDGTIITRVKYNETRFKENYYFNIQSLTKQITNIYRKTIDTEKLAKVIKDEKDRKYKELIERVTKITGKITDASNLKIGNQHGEINGTIVGEKGKCIIETISAGGYNIQCFHYRVLIKEVK